MQYLYHYRFSEITHIITVQAKTDQLDGGSGQERIII